MTGPHPIPDAPEEPYVFGVWKPHPDLPFGSLGKIDGQWELIEDISVVKSVGGWPVTQTDRYVERSDGERARVFEVGP
jgi:hypothetical protein